MNQYKYRSNSLQNGIAGWGLEINISIKRDLNVNCHIYVTDH